MFIIILVTQCYMKRWFNETTSNDPLNFMTSLKGQCQGIAHVQSHARSHARVTSKNKTVGEMDLGISQLFRFYSILSV